MQTGVAVKKAIVDRRNPKQQETKSSRDRDEGLGIGMKGRRPTMTLGIMEDVFITLSLAGVTGSERWDASVPQTFSIQFREE